MYIAEWPIPGAKTLEDDDDEDFSTVSTTDMPPETFLSVTCWGSLFYKGVLRPMSCALW